jgi:hypothetical protein
MTIIKLRELFSNNKFSLYLKVKILQIPKDFIFINTKSEIIKENDILEITDELKVIQYDRYSVNNYIKIVGIALASEIHPSNPKSKTELNIYYEGVEGNIKIIYSDENCLNGYYSFGNLCTKQKPPKYYLDEERKSYMPCISPCDDCNGPFSEENMNCITCEDNYYFTEDSNSSCFKEKENYYLDNNILKRCHPRCSKCITGSENDTNMNCLECIDDGRNEYFYKEDTLNCILPSEIPKRAEIVLKTASNYVFYIFLCILIVSIMFSIICCLVSLFTKENPPNVNGENINIELHRLTNDYEENQENIDNQNSIN